MYRIKRIKITFPNQIKKVIHKNVTFFLENKIAVLFSLLLAFLIVGMNESKPISVSSRRDFYSLPMQQNSILDHGRNFFSPKIEILIITKMRMSTFIKMHFVQCFARTLPLSHFLSSAC